MSDNEEGEGEDQVEKLPEIDYEATDEEGFFVVEKQIWTEYQKWLKTPEDEREQGELEEWQESFAEKSRFDPNRIKKVVTIGLYAGERDDKLQRHGRGHSIYKNGDAYMGVYNENQKEGLGVYTFYSLAPDAKSQTIYEKWTQFQKESETDPDPHEFTKSIQKTLGKTREVIVAAIAQNGPHPYYRGDYEANQKCGSGDMKYADGGFYSGKWSNDQRNGFGYYYYPNGDVYTGLWKDNLKNGEGRYEFADQKVQSMHIDGVWNAGNFEKGQWKLTESIEYIGKFENNLPKDFNGKFTFSKNDVQQNGEFSSEGRWIPKFSAGKMEDDLGFVVTNGEATTNAQDLIQEAIDLGETQVLPTDTITQATKVSD